MKFEFNLKEKKASFEADVEGLVQKNLDHKANNPDRKTRYQIKQEEKRKSAEQKQKQLIQGVLLLLGISVLFALIGMIGSIFGI